QMEATVAEQVAALGPAASTRICQHLVAIGEDETRAGKAEAARAARHLHVRPVGGMLAVDGLLAPAQAGPLLTALDAYSQPVPAGPDGIPDPRTAGQRKADALGEIASVVLDRGAPSVGGLRPHLQLVLHVDAAAAAPDPISPTGPNGQNNPDGPAQPYGPAGRSGPASHPGEPRDPVQPNGPAGGSGTSGGDWAGEPGYRSYPGYPSEAHAGPLRRDELEEMSCDAEVSWLAVRDPQPGHPPDTPRPDDRRPDDQRPGDHPPDGRPPDDHPPGGQPADGHPAGDGGGAAPVLHSPTGLPLYRWIIAAIRAALPPALGGSSPDILAAGRSIRLVPPHIRRALNVRDQGCVHPGCDRAPARCHAHHIQHWLHGGPTDLDNLVLACAYHHQRWHREHLKPVRQPDGSWQIQPDPHAAAGHQHGHARGRHAA
ncbi:MAG TPA: DUF222 domain-containing protein, partial [Mycobacteriales bacterium]|nr:DUF222 domain-containing protein [Mycobacteriales bacterium]